MEKRHLEKIKLQGNTIGFSYEDYLALVLPSLLQFPAIINKKVTFREECMDIVVHASLWITEFLKSFTHLEAAY